MSEVTLLSPVALLEDLPGKALRRGQVGTVVEALNSEVFEVEFSDEQGRTYASVAVEASRLLPLLHEPANQAAA